MARKSEGLSDRHRKIMDFLTKFQESNGYSPSIRQIGDNIGVKSTSLIDYYLNQLQEKKFIERDEHVSRSIRLLKPLHLSVQQMYENVRASMEEVLQIPIWGPIAAGLPLNVPDTASIGAGVYDSLTTVDIARSLLPAREKPSELFALRVQGDSMIDAMINDGDIVIMKPATEAYNGEMVAVWLDDKDETTLKYFYRENNHVRLQPANPSYDPIIIDNPQHLRIQGKVVMVIRQVKNLAS